MPILHQYSHTTLQNCSNVIYESGHKLGLLRWENGASLIYYRINKSSIPLWKVNNLTFTKIYWKLLEATLRSKQHFTLSYIFFPPLQPHHIPNASEHCLSISWVGISSPFFVTLAIFLITFTCIYFVSTFFSRGNSLVATESHALHTTWKGLIINHSVDW